MTSRDVVVVIGGGTMGAGIAQSLLQTGCQVIIREAAPKEAATAARRVAEGLARAHRREVDADAIVQSELGRFTVADELPGEIEPALVIEAVPESATLKKAVLREVSAQYRTAVIASNTSSLSISDLAGAVRHPERFIGMHFFNPVPVSLLVELVAGEQTSDETVEIAGRWVARLAKESIVVSDAPGFATSRLGVALGLEAIRMVEAGVASVEDIDRGMELGYRHPIGPLRLTDLVGLDVRLGIANHLASTLGPRFEPPDLLRTMVAAGSLGKKSGQGFYRWD